MKYIATISGGKDSVTMCDLLLKNGYPVDYIIFQDTLMEFGMMYEYIQKLKDYFKSRYGMEITVLKPNTTFEEWCFGTIKDKNADKFGFIRGIPMVWQLPCYWRREAKEKPSTEFLKQFEDEEVTTYIGYTLYEDRSIKDTEKYKYSYPLKEIFKMTEDDCKAYLISQEMENPLYRFFDRTGCGMCSAQSDKAWYEVWKNFKEVWSYMCWIEDRLNFYEKIGMMVHSKHWFNKFRTCADMEKLFKKTEKQGTLFDLSDEPLKDCFCKI